MALSSGSLRLGAVAKPEVGPVSLATYCDLLTLLFSPLCPLLPQQSFSLGMLLR